MLTLRVAVVVSILIAGPAVADIINVPGDYPDIQAAIDAAVDGDEIRVSPGSYAETIDLLGKALRVHSTDGPEVTSIEQFMVTSGESESARIEGMEVLRGGSLISNANLTLSECRFRLATGEGRALLIEDATAEFKNCDFVDFFVEGDQLGPLALRLEL